MIEDVWYDKGYILFEICKQLQHKYLSFRFNGSYSRYYMGHCIELLKDSLVRHNCGKVPLKLYMDLAYWKTKMQVFSFNTKIRSVQKETFNDTFEQYMVGYDFAIDIDNKKNIMKSWEDANIIKKLFDYKQIPYSIKFSGSRGFHFLIPYRYVSKRYKVINLPDLFSDVVRGIVNEFNLKNVDETIYDSRRVLKLAYSVDGNNVVLPLTDEQFDNFDLHKVSVPYVLTNVKLFKRGLLTRKHGLNERELSKSFNKMIVKYK